AILVYFMFVFAGRAEVPVHPKPLETGPRPGDFFKRVSKPFETLIPDEHRLERVWTIIPAIILLILAIAQLQTWLRIKDPNTMTKQGEQAWQMEVSARQFEWRVRYPSIEHMKTWETNPELRDDFKPRRYFNQNTKTWIDNAGSQEDDIHVVNEVHTWK